MSLEGKSDLHLEIAHVLFIDVVGFSKLLIKDQSEILERLNLVVRDTPHFREAEAASKLIRLPTGDGIALVFSDSAEAPVECALEITKALKSYPQVQLRMGVHSGPVNAVRDVNDRSNVTGAGINMAQRVMDCGDAGHILLSKRVAEDLQEYEQWRPLLHDLGSCEVKHGARVSVVNLYADEVGNPQLPKKFQALKKHRARMRWAGTTAALLALAAIFTGIAMFAHYRVRSTLAAPEKSIAVLPFENLSDEKQNAYFADGVQDEILTDLARIADLKVISRTSVMQYKTGVARNLREIGQQLGVAHLLEGSVQRVANRVRVNAQLIDTRTDAHLWAQTYDRDLADVFAIQSEIAKAIADQLQAKISPLEKAAITQAPTNDLAANALYVQAKQLESESSDTTQSLPQAVLLLDEAVARDGHFLLAYCLLARVHLALYFGGIDHSPARRELANAAVQTAARLQPGAGEVHLALAYYAYQGFRDYDRARAELELARATLPNDAVIYALTAAIDRRQARWAESIRNYDRAVELDPRNSSVLMNAAFTYQRLHRFTEADRLFERVIAISSRNYAARMLHAMRPFLERADVRPLRAELSKILNEEPQAAEQIADTLLDCALLERDSDAAKRALAAIPPKGIATSGNFSFPREWFVGLGARVFNDAATARTAFTTSRAIVEKLVREQPDYAPAWSLLGRIDAALGRKEDAVREGQHACELLPLSKDAWIGRTYVIDLAIIYAWNGEKKLALEQLAICMQPPTGIAYGSLKLDPDWDPLRGDPRFEKIVASLAPTDAK
ncbi:MAG: hypothetical protein QOG67_1845 [Verrucomicrobiota bacterium]|jgi:serine/threonine-protein kinase